VGRTRAIFIKEAKKRWGGWFPIATMNTPKILNIFFRSKFEGRTINPAKKKKDMGLNLP
jgi:hypothetical protein